MWLKKGNFILGRNYLTFIIYSKARLITMYKIFLSSFQHCGEKETNEEEDFI